MGYREFRDWQMFATTTPFGEIATDRRLATLTAAVMAPHAKRRGSRAADPRSYQLIQSATGEGEPDDESLMIAMLERMAQEGG